MAGRVLDVWGYLMPWWLPAVIGFVVTFLVVSSLLRRRRR